MGGRTKQASRIDKRADNKSPERHIFCRPTSQTRNWQTLLRPRRASSLFHWLDFRPRGSEIKLPELILYWYNSWVNKPSFKSGCLANFSISNQDWIKPVKEKESTDSISAGDKPFSVANSGKNLHGRNIMSNLNLLWNVQLGPFLLLEVREKVCKTSLELWPKIKIQFCIPTLNFSWR